MRTMVAAIEAEFRRYKALGDSTLAQLEDADVARVPAGQGNSVAVLVWHVAGNLESRFTDFLTSDGEKPWRDRDAEFDTRTVTKAETVTKWEAGWRVLLDAVGRLTDQHLDARVSVRGQSLSVADALARSLAHTAYHVGQVVFVGKMWRAEAWTCLSIPRGASRTYNERPTLERPSAHAAALKDQSIQPPPTTTSSS